MALVLSPTAENDRFAATVRDMPKTFVAVCDAVTIGLADTVVPHVGTISLRAFPPDVADQVAKALSFSVHTEPTRTLPPDVSWTVAADPTEPSRADDALPTRESAIARARQLLRERGDTEADDPATAAEIGYVWHVDFRPVADEPSFGGGLTVKIDRRSGRLIEILAGQ